MTPTATGTTLRVLVVDDHPVVLSGVRTQLEGADGIGCVGTAGDGRSALAAVANSRPDVVVLDISLPDMSGFDVARQLRQTLPECPFLFLSVHDDEEYVLEAVDCGARGYVLKSDSPDELRRAVQAVSSGDTHFSSRVTPALVRHLVQSARPASPCPLTPREREVLVMIADGHTNRQIAAFLDLSVRTVQTYRERMMKKLDLHSVAELTRYAINEGIVPTCKSL